MTAEVGRGLLAVLADPREGMAAEFDRWFEDEHLYERSAIEGALFSRRYVSLEGTPHSLALYELARPEVLHEDAYLGASKIEDEARAAENARRVATGDSRPPILDPGARMTAIRQEYALVEAAGQHPGEIGAFIWMVRERVAPGDEAALDAWYAGHLPVASAVPGVRGVKRYRLFDGTPGYLVLYELARAEVVRGAAWAAAFAGPRPSVLDTATNLAQFFKVVYHDDAVREMADRLSDYSKRA